MAVVSGQSTGTTEMTPSGIEVYYQSTPKRLYRVRKHELNDDPEEPEYEAGPWREVPSVTTVLDVLAKPALPWWGMKVGADGVRELASLRTMDSEIAEWITTATVDSLVDELTEHKLTVNHVRDKAGTRGQSVHDALEAWAKTGHRPDPKIYPDEERGYIEGLIAFLNDVPSAEPEACEVLVASIEHGFAGRYDLRLRTHEPHPVVVHRTKTRVHHKILMPGETLVDLKTSKGIYGSHARQLEAYEQASIESGYEPSRGRGILHVGADGTYEFVRSWATFSDFKCVLDVWRSEQEMKSRIEKFSRKSGEDIT